MATNNSGDEPRIIALQRQVQTLVVVVECLTKQNHDLEEQSCQRDVRPNSHREEQEGTSAEKRDWEGLEGNNALSKQEQQDTSYPSIVKTAPPHVVAKI